MRKNWPPSEKLAAAVGEKMRLTFVIIAICLVVFFGFETVDSLLPHFVLVPIDLLARPWTLVTSMFAHGGLEHLIFNMFALFMFGSVLENKLGSNKFLFLYLVAGILGSIGFMLLNDPRQAVLGASGAIFGIFGALVLLAPNMRVYIYLIPVPMWVAGILYAGIELFALGSVDNIAHSAHLLGLVAGLAIASREGKDAWPPKPPMDFKAALGIPLIIAILVALAFGLFYNSVMGV